MKKPNTKFNIIIYILSNNMIIINNIKLVYLISSNFNKIDSITI
jgi:hypothetical protein